MTSDLVQRLFAEIVVPHLDDAYGLARWLTGNPSDAEDVVQDACLKALAALKTAGVRNGRAWVLAIVRNTALTRLARRRGERLVASDDLENAAGVDLDLSPEEKLIARIDVAELTQAIAALPLAFRETLVMREINDLSYREIAEATGVPVGTVMSRLARARALLTSALREFQS